MRDGTLSAQELAELELPWSPEMVDAFRIMVGGTIRAAKIACGLEAIGDIWVQFKVQYYIFALIFVVFDIETVFIYPWAVAYKQIGLFALLEMIVFILILVMGLAYAWRKGALEWV